MFHDATTGHSGQKSVRYEATATANQGAVLRNQQQAAGPGRQYKLSAWVKTNVAQNFLICGRLMTAAAGYIAENQGNRTWLVGVDWTYIESLVFNGDSRASCQGVEIIASGGTLPRTLWVDDVKIERIA